VTIKAPKSVSVHRKEIYEAIQREKEARIREIQNEENLKKLEACQIPRAKATGLVALGRGSNSNVRRKS